MPAPSEKIHSAGNSGRTLHIRIEHPYLPPIGLLLLDKAEMIRSFLIGVMAGLIVKDNLQRNVEIPVVHLPGQLGIQPGS